MSWSRVAEIAGHLKHVATGRFRKLPVAVFVSDSGSNIHGTVVANTDSWVFFYTFSEADLETIPHVFSAIELS